MAQRVSTRLSRFLYEQSISRRTVAEGAGIQVQRLHRLCQGRQDPTVEERASICELLGEQEAELFPFVNVPADKVPLERARTFFNSPEGEMMLQRWLDFIHG